MSQGENNVGKFKANNFSAKFLFVKYFLRYLNVIVCIYKAHLSF